MPRVHAQAQVVAIKVTNNKEYTLSCFLEEACKKNQDHNLNNIFSMEYGPSMREDWQGNERALSVMWTGEGVTCECNLTLMPSPSGDAVEI